MRVPKQWIEDKLFNYMGYFGTTNNMLPVRKHELDEELLQFQKDFASLIYMRKDLERRNY